jgi:D-alanyl-D-alanine carboxypeptidase
MEVCLMLSASLLMRRLVSSALVSAVLATGSTCAGPQARADAPTPASDGAAPASAAAQGDVDRAERQLESVADKVVAAGFPGVVLSQRTARGTTAVASGVADVSSGRPARPADRYRIGSATKTMTAVVVLQLVAEGRLRLDDRVAPWLPNFGLDRRITVRHLLQQTSGFLTDTMVFSPPRSYESNRLRHFRPAELVRLALTNPDPRPEPGSRHVYANTNYVLAGMVIEKVTGHSVRDELTRRIIRPLGLTSTSFPERSPFVTGRHLRGYLPAEPNTPPQDTTVYSMSWAWTAGAVVSTTEDETAFLRALMTGRLLPKPLLETMMDTGDFGYGLGLYPVRVPCVPGGIAWGHNGMVFGYHATVFSTPDGSRQAAIGANTWLFEESGAINWIAEQAAAAALCDDPSLAGVSTSPGAARLSR